MNRVSTNGVFVAFFLTIGITYLYYDVVLAESMAHCHNIGALGLP
ncbi:MAG: hypothetical protein V7K53_23655 [Nostoc sp.]